MTVVLSLVVGFLAVRFLLISGRDILQRPVLMRENYRGWPLPTSAGLFAILAVVVVEAGRSTLGAFGVGDEPGVDWTRPLVLYACLGFGLLGFVDDILGDGDDRGFRGHLRALARGKVTTGLLKIIGGAAIAFVLVAQADYVSSKRLLSDAILIALAANLGNLLDRAPGRVVKVAVVAWIPLAFFADASGVAIAVVIGAFVGLLGDDLREHLMLGDTGANVLGAVLGLAVVIDVGRGARNVVLIALVVLNLAAELVSFSAVIERVPPLRWFDRLGRRTQV